MGLEAGWRGEERQWRREEGLSESEKLQPREELVNGTLLIIMWAEEAIDKIFYFKMLPVELYSSHHC